MMTFCPLLSSQPRAAKVPQGWGCSSQSPRNQNQKINPGRDVPSLQGTSCEDATTPYQALLRSGLLLPLLHVKICARVIFEVPEIFDKGEGTATTLYCHILFCYAAFFHQFLPEEGESGKQLDFVRRTPQINSK